MPTILYPSVFNPPFASNQVAPQNWDVTIPLSVRRPVPQQPQSDAIPSGAFTTTNTTQGGTALAPVTTRRLVPQQPQCDVLPPGVFAGTTTNVVKGWDAIQPPVTRRSIPQQPPGGAIPPGQFTTTNTQFGGEAFAPIKTSRLNPQQPQADTLPPGAFTTISTQFGGEAFFPNGTRGATRQLLGAETFVTTSLVVITSQGWGTVAPIALPLRSLTRVREDAWVSFAPLVAPNTQFGWDAWFPVRAIRLWPQQPPGPVLPPGAFATTVVPGGGICATFSLVPSVNATVSVEAC